MSAVVVALQGKNKGGPSAARFMPCLWVEVNPYDVALRRNECRVFYQTSFPMGRPVLISACRFSSVMEAIISSMLYLGSSGWVTIKVSVLTRDLYNAARGENGIRNQNQFVRQFQDDATISLLKVYKRFLSPRQ